jgi:hypothetical protein
MPRRSSTMHAPPNPSLHRTRLRREVLASLTRIGLGSQSCWTRIAAPVNSIVHPRKIEQPKSGILTSVPLLLFIRRIC